MTSDPKNPTLDFPVRARHAGARAAVILGLCIAITAAFLAEIWHPPAFAHPTEAAPVASVGEP